MSDEDTPRAPARGARHFDAQQREPSSDAITRCVARNVRSLAARRGIPLAHLADRAGIGRTTMFRLLDASERKPSDPRLSTLAALAAALEVETFDLLMEHDEGR